MSVVLTVPLIALALTFVPVLLLRQAAFPRPQSFCVAAEHTPPGVIQNSIVGYGLKMATFGPLFVFGAQGNILAGIVASVSYGLGLLLLYVLRGPILGYLEGALADGRSITAHALIARQHHDGQRVRRLAAGLAVAALTGLAITEAAGVAIALRPLLPYSFEASLWAAALLLLAVVINMPAGNSGVMRAAQSQLGMSYLGLFGAAAFLLYLQTSALAAMPSYGTFAVAVMAAVCVALIVCRRSRYLDTSPVRAARSGDNRSSSRTIAHFRRLEKVVNVCITTLAVLVVVVAAMQLSSRDPAEILDDSLTALKLAPRGPALMFAMLVMLPLVYPIVDITNWQRIAALATSAVAPAERPAALRLLLRRCVIESSLMWLFICMLGALAGIATGTPRDAADIAGTFVGQLDSQPNIVAATALALFLIAVFAMALSAMSTTLSALIGTLHYDLLAPHSSQPPSAGHATTEHAAGRRSLTVGSGLWLGLAAAFCLLDSWGPFTGATFVALLLASVCAQLPLVPAVLAALLGRGRGPASALAPTAMGAIAGIGSIGIYLATGQEAWLWLAVPACLGVALLISAPWRSQ